MKRIGGVLLYFVLATTFAQKSTAITGIVLFEKTVIEYVHIYNVDTKKGTISNSNGEFIITVHKDDYLHFSIIPYKKLQIKVTDTILHSKKITINLIEDINTLEKVEVSNRKLIANLRIASEKVPQDINTKFAIKIDKSNIVYNQVPIYESIDDRGLNEVDAKYNTMNVFTVIGLIINKISKKKKNENFQKSTNVKINEMPKIFREQVGDAFFEQSLHIKKPNIELFLEKYKNNKKFINLYLENKLLECMDLLIRDNK